MRKYFSKSSRSPTWIKFSSIQEKDFPNSLEDLISCGIENRSSSIKKTSRSSVKEKQQDRDRKYYCYST